jgi:opacity protein-like surface antigen
MRRILILLMGIAVSTGALAQNFRIPKIDDSRAGKWDVAFQLVHVPSETYGGEQGSSLSLKSRTGWGFGLAYNLNSHFALGFDFSWVDPRYTATLIDTDDSGTPTGSTTTIEHRADIITGQLKGIWNIFKSDFTPYAEVAGGWTNIDSNVSDSVPVCWFDPWWGWVCSTSSYNESNFSYGGGLGFRWDVGRSTLLKLSYNRMVIDSGRSPELDSIKFEIGASY